MPPKGLPRLVDLGSTTCIPCKMMAPVLEELKEYAGGCEVEFIDVKENPRRRQIRHPDDPHAGFL